MQSSSVVVSPAKPFQFYPEWLLPLMTASLLTVVSHVITWQIALSDIVMITIPLFTVSHAGIRSRLKRCRELMRIVYKINEALIKSGHFTYAQVKTSVKKPDTPTKDPRPIAWPFEVKRVKANKNNYRVIFRTPVGQVDEGIVKLAPILASSLEAWKLLTEPQSRAGTVSFLIQFKDPLQQPAFKPQNKMNEKQKLSCNTPLKPTYLSEGPIRIGITETGEIARIDIYGRNVLISGIPGSGKSVGVEALLCAAANDPSCILVVIDLKGGVQLSIGEERYDYFCTNNHEAVVILRGIIEEITRRNVILRSRKQEKVARNDLSMPPILVFIDEMAEFVRGNDEDGEECMELATRGVAVGRSALVSFVSSSQKNDGSVIKTGYRDNVSGRICYRTGNKEHAITALGPLQDGVQPWLLEKPGMGYLIGINEGCPRFMGDYKTREENIEFLAKTVKAHKDFIAKYPISLKPIEIERVPKANGYKKK